MRDGRIGADHQIEVLHEGGRIHERTKGCVEATAKVQDGRPIWQLVKLLNPRSLLNADQSNSLYVGKTHKVCQSNGSLQVIAVCGAALPRDPDFECWLI